MKQPLRRRGASLLLGLCLLAGAALPVGAARKDGTSARASELPVLLPTQSGVTVHANTKASVDASNLNEGYVMVKYTGGKDVRIKVQISKSGANLYTYDLNQDGTVETFPLTEGDGTYDIKVFENTTGSKYAQVYSTSVTMALRNEFLPFLYANQYVSYTADGATAAKAAALCQTAGDDLEKVSCIFDYVVDHFTYDYDKAATVPPGYLPVVDDIVSTQTGICLDYAATMAAMLRSQNIPCKLVVGYAGTIYHAWIDVYVGDTGWVSGAIYFDGVTWTLMDPTFVSTGKRDPYIMSYVTDSSHYSQKYAY